MSTKRPRPTDAAVVASSTAATAAAGSAEKKARIGAVGTLPPSTANKGAATATPARGSAAAPGNKASPATAAEKKAPTPTAGSKPTSGSAPASVPGGVRRPAANIAPGATGNARAPVAFKVAPAARPAVKPLPPIESFAAQTDEGGDGQNADGGGAGGGDGVGDGDGSSGGAADSGGDLANDGDERVPTGGDGGADEAGEDALPDPVPPRASVKAAATSAMAPAPKKPAATSGTASSVPRPSPSAKPSVGNRSVAPAASLSSLSSTAAAAAPKKLATGKLALVRSRPTVVAAEDVKAPDDAACDDRNQAPSDATDGGADLEAGGGGGGGDGGGEYDVAAGGATVNPDGEFPVDLAQDLGLDGDSAAPPAPVVAPAPKKPGVAPGKKAATATTPGSGTKLVAPPAAAPKTKTAPVTPGGAASKPTGNAKPSNTIAATDASLRRSGIAIGTDGGGGGATGPAGGNNSRRGGGGGGGGGGNGVTLKGASGSKVGGGGGGGGGGGVVVARAAAAPKKPASQKPAEVKKAPPRLEVPFGIYRHYKRAAYEREIDAAKLANGPEWAAQLSPEQQMEEAGRYYYKVIDVANHTEQRGERLVICRPLYKSFVYAHGRESDARPIEVFLGDVAVPSTAQPTEDGAEASEIVLPRFERVPDEDAQGLEEIYAYLYSTDATDGAPPSG